MLFTTKEIAEIYGGENKNVTPYMITHTWIPNGLKYIRGKGNSFLFKREWVEQYIDEQTIIRENNNSKTKNIKMGTKKIRNNNYFVH